MVCLEFMWNRSDSKTITYKNPPREISEEDFHKQQINNYLHNTTLLQFVCKLTAERRITLHIAIGFFRPSKGPGGPGAVPQEEGIVGVEGIGPQLLFYLRIGSHRLPVHAQLHLGGNNHFPGTEGAAVGLVVVLPVAGINQEVQHGRLSLRHAHHGIVLQEALAEDFGLVQEAASSKAARSRSLVFIGLSQ